MYATYGHSSITWRAATVETYVFEVGIGEDQLLQLVLFVNGTFNLLYTEVV